MVERVAVCGSGRVGMLALAALSAILTVPAAAPAAIPPAAPAADSPTRPCRRFEPLLVGASLAGLVASCGHPLAGAAGVDLWPLMAGDRKTEGPGPAEGELVAVVRVTADWLDLRGEPVAAGYYAARVQTPPRRKEHVGIPAGWHPVVLAALAQDPGTLVVERPATEWIDGVHPRVLGLVRSGPVPPSPGEGPPTLVEQVLPHAAGELTLRSGRLPPVDL
jgi:hypothetical protein